MEYFGNYQEKVMLKFYITYIMYINILQKNI